MLEQETLPRGWIKTTLGQTVALSKEKVEPKDFNSKRYVGLEHIESNTGAIIRYGSSASTQSTKNVFVKGDILYGRLRPYLNKVCIPDFDGICSTDILVLKPYKFIMPSFLCLYLGTMDFVQFATIASQGVNLPRVKFSTIENYQILLPPQNEQKRIVSKIESIFTHVDTLEGSLKSLKLRMAQLRQVVLKQAFEGRLVPQDPNDEPAELLLKRLHKSDKELKFEKDELPEGWISIRFGSITKNFDNKRIPISKNRRKKIYGTIPYYGASGVIDHVNQFIFDGEYLLISEDGANLLTRTTPIAFIAGGKFWVNNHAHVLKTLYKISLKFLLYYINSIDLSIWVSGTAQPKLNQTNLNKIPIKIPPLSEQYRIVSKIESIFTQIDTLEWSLKSLKSWTAQLRQVVLKMAFEGRLVPQNPHNEPTHKLLERRHVQ